MAGRSSQVDTQRSLGKTQSTLRGTQPTLGGTGKLTRRQRGLGDTGALEALIAQHQDDTKEAYPFDDTKSMPAPLKTLRPIDTKPEGMEATWRPKTTQSAAARKKRELGEVPESARGDGARSVGPATQRKIKLIDRVYVTYSPLKPGTRGMTVRKMVEQEANKGAFRPSHYMGHYNKGHGSLAIGH